MNVVPRFLTETEICSDWKGCPVCPQVEEHECPQVEEHKCPPVEEHECPPVEEHKCPPVEDCECPEQKVLERYSGASPQTTPVVWLAVAVVCVIVLLIFLIIRK